MISFELILHKLHRCSDEIELGKWWNSTWFKWHFLWLPVYFKCVSIFFRTLNHSYWVKRVLKHMYIVLIITWFDWHFNATAHKIRIAGTQIQLFLRFRQFHWMLKSLTLHPTMQIWSFETTQCLISFCFSENASLQIRNKSGDMENARGSVHYKCVNVWICENKYLYVFFEMDKIDIDLLGNMLIGRFWLLIPCRFYLNTMEKCLQTTV